MYWNSQNKGVARQNILTKMSWQKYLDKSILTKISWWKYLDENILTKISWQKIYWQKHLGLISFRVHFSSKITIFLPCQLFQPKIIQFFYEILIDEGMHYLKNLRNTYNIHPINFSFVQDHYWVCTYSASSQFTTSQFTDPQIHVFFYKFLENFQFTDFKKIPPNSL